MLGLAAMLAGPAGADEPSPQCSVHPVQPGANVDTAVSAVNGNLITSASMGYLGHRAGDWIRDRKCISCHTGMPYMLAWSATGGAEGAATAQAIRDQAASRVEAWPNVTPWYHSSDTKTQEALGSESVINALTLSTFDSTRQPATLAPVTQRALDAMLAQQRPGGGWAWLDYKLEPWESDQAQYFGAALGALALGRAPGQYLETANPAQVSKLKTFLRASYRNGKMSLHSQLMLLWASSKFPGLLRPREKLAIARAVLGRRRADGSWPMGALGRGWEEQGTASTGKAGGSAYATAFISAALLESGSVSRDDSRLRGSLSWLRGRFDAATGSWAARSVNSNDDFNHGLATDAATGYALVALSKGGEL